MDRIDIQGTTKTQLVTSLNVFSYWIINQPKTVLYNQKILRWSKEVTAKNIVTVRVMLKRRNYFASYNVLKDCNNETCQKHLKKVVEIKGTTYYSHKRRKTKKRERLSPQDKNKISKDIFYLRQVILEVKKCYKIYCVI